jgi:glucan 1,3-beta-glucosidase
MGYEPLNEPWHGGKQPLFDFVARWYETVRPLAPEKILVLPGMGSGVRFYGDPAEHGWKNIMFDMHWYPGLFGWGKPTPMVHRNFIADLEKNHRPYASNLGVPMLHGECNVVYKAAGGGRMMRHYCNRYERWGWVPAIWSYKNLNRNGGIPKDAFWGMVANRKPLPNINLMTSSKTEIEAFLRSFATMDYVVDEDLRHWLQTDEPLPSLDAMVAEFEGTAKEKADSATQSPQ